MPDFTQRIETSDGCFDVSFEESSAAPEGGEYLVTVVEDDYAAPPFFSETNGLRLEDFRRSASSPLAAATRGSFARSNSRKCGIK